MKSTLYLCDDSGVPAEKLTPERRRQLTRQALIEAAAEVFAEKGFHGASLEEIAEAAGFTRGAIYSNFENKEDLLFAVLDHYLDVEIEAISGELGSYSGPDTNEATVAAAMPIAEYSMGTPSWPALSLELRLSALRNPEVRRRLVEHERRSADKVLELIEHEMERRGTVMRIPPEDFAVISRAFIEGIGQLAALDTENADRYRRLAEELFVVLADAVFESKP